MVYPFKAPGSSIACGGAEGMKAAETSGGIDLTMEEK